MSRVLAGRPLLRLQSAVAEQSAMTKRLLHRLTGTWRKWSQQTEDLYDRRTCKRQPCDPHRARQSSAPGSVRERRSAPSRLQWLQTQPSGKGVRARVGCGTARARSGPAGFMAAPTGTGFMARSHAVRGDGYACRPPTLMASAAGIAIRQQQTGPPFKDWLQTLSLGDKMTPVSSLT